MTGGIHSARSFYPILILFFAYSVVKGQDSGFGSWNIVNLKYRLNDRLSLFGEGQVRSLQFYHDFHYHEFKGGAEYQLFPNARLALAAGKYDTYKEGGNFVQPKTNKEFRIWPQLVLHQSFRCLNLEQRYRAEMRFTGTGYKNRFRSRFGLSYPFGKGEKGTKPFHLNASNEIFFTDRGPYFERNRFLISLNYKCSATTILQLGYLRQFDYKINDETGHNFLIFGIFLDINRAVIHREKHDIDLKDY